jgi:hypothetical protein
LTGEGLTLGEWGGIGEFHQNGKTLVVLNDLTLGRQNDPDNGGPGQGHYWMEADQDGNQPSLNTGFTNIGSRGIGIFDQSAGVHTVASDFRLGEISGSSGTYNLGGTGQLNIGGFMRIGDAGQGIFNQNGGDVVVTGAGGEGVTVAYQPGGQGAYNMSKGSLTAGLITNNGHFTVQNGGTIEQPILINGNVNNNGVFNVHEAVVNFNGVFTNNNEFHSDPAVMNFNDLIITPAGYLTAQSGDAYHVAGAFESRSALPDLYMVRNGQLIFSDGAHSVAFNSQNLGALASAYANNFAWGYVDFGKGSFTLTGDSGALYTGLIAQDSLLLNGNIITSVSGDNDIFYLAKNENGTLNDWLGGNTYSFTSGTGQLKPVGVVPEPLSCLLFLLGAGAFVGGSRLRKI